MIPEIDGSFRARILVSMPRGIGNRTVIAQPATVFLRVHKEPVRYATSEMMAAVPFSRRCAFPR